MEQERATFWPLGCILGRHRPTGATRLLPLKKADRMETFVAALGSDPALALHPCYQGYFACFNEGRYYEAHDVLEHLWLQEDSGGANHAFYKGLIQLAGAFVHLRQQYEHPTHVKHGRRLRPAARLFALASANLDLYEPTHLGLDVHAVRGLCARQIALLVGADFTRNPWSPGAAPRLLPSGNGAG